MFDQLFALVLAQNTLILLQFSSYGLILLGLLLIRQKILGMTILAAWGWCLITATLLASCDGLLSQQPNSSWAEAARFAVAAFTFCPMMAVLGRKRPQNRPWQFIVFSLWIITVLPACQAVLFRAGSQLELHVAQSWFNLILLVIGLVNYLPTRFALSAILYTLGQYCLLSHYLPIQPIEVGQYGSLLSTVFFLSSVISTLLLSFRFTNDQFALNGVWVEFRNIYGVIWAMRIQQRVNVLAELQSWPVYLGWEGFEFKDSKRGAFSLEQLDESTQRAIEKQLRTLLRRFVSREWLNVRLKKG